MTPPPECVNVSNVGNVDGEKLSDKKKQGLRMLEC